MAQEGTKSEKLNLRIHLSGSKYIVSDGLCYWIVRESKGIAKSGKHQGEEVIRKTRLSGYHTDMVSLLESYFAETVRHTEIDGELEDLVKLIKKVRKEIRGWFGRLDGAFEMEGEDE